MARKPGTTSSARSEPLTIDSSGLKHVRKTLRDLAAKHDDAARRHLRVGRYALIAGLLFAIFLPAFFTLIDSAVEQLRTTIAPGVTLEQEDNRIEELGGRQAGCAPRNAA